MIKHIAALFVTVMLSLNAFAQTDIAILPEFKNKVYFITKANKLEKLDNTTLQFTSKQKNMGNKLVYQLEADGAQSSVAHSGSPKNRFIVRLEEGTDPEDVVSLIKFEIIKNKRVINMGGVQASAFSAIKRNASEITYAKLNIEKVQNGVYILSPQAQLPDGEYVFMIARSKSPAACFSVQQEN